MFEIDWETYWSWNMETLLAWIVTGNIPGNDNPSNEQPDCKKNPKSNLPRRDVFQHPHPDKRVDRYHLPNDFTFWSDVNTKTWS